MGIIRPQIESTLTRTPLTVFAMVYTSFSNDNFKDSYSSRCRLLQGQGSSQHMKARRNLFPRDPKTWIIEVTLAMGPNDVKSPTWKIEDVCMGSRKNKGYYLMKRRLVQEGVDKAQPRPLVGSCTHHLPPGQHEGVFLEALLHSRHTKGSSRTKDVCTTKCQTS